MTLTARILAEIGQTIAALCGDLRDWKGRGRHTPAPTAEPQPDVQPDHTQDELVANPMKAGLHQQAILINGSRSATLWVDAEGCNIPAQVHAGMTDEHWNMFGMTPTCSHFRIDRGDEHDGC